MEVITRIAAGWYFWGDEEVHDIVVNYSGEAMFEVSNEVAKILVAQDMGYSYTTDIDFRYFDRSCNNEHTSI